MRNNLCRRVWQSAIRNRQSEISGPPMMSLSRLVLRSLLHYWRINLAVLLACAVGVAVLIGSLLVGDSVRFSLRALTLERLGRIDQALVSEHFFREELAEAFPDACPAILLNGSAAHARSGRRASRVQALGVRESFWRFGGAVSQPRAGDPDSEWWKSVGLFEAALNGALAQELQAREGDDVLLRVQKPSAIPRQTFLGQRDQTVLTLRLQVARVVPSEGLGRFSLAASQFQPLNIYVPLEALQRRLKQESRANAIFAAGSGEDLQTALAKAFDLTDVGLALRPNPKRGWLSIESAQIFLPPYLAGVAIQRAADLSLAAAPTLAYLVNSMTVGAPPRDRAIPYSMVAALDRDVPPDGQILLNTWAAEDLKARAGEAIELRYFVSGPRGELQETTSTLTVAGTVPMSDPRVDAGLVPEFPGISDAESLAHWDPPFPLDLNRIRPTDEEYWKKYRAAPKGLVSLKTGQALWANPYGSLTSIRLSTANPATVSEALLERIDPAKAGLAFQPVKDQGLAASKGASDFGALFLGFSLFLLVSAAILIHVLFRLGVEGRARQYGLLSAVGFAPRRAQALMLAEGAAVAAAGGVVGLGLGIGYARLLVLGLGAWWIEAIGTAFLRLSIRPLSLLAGLAGGWAVAMLSIWRAARRLSRAPARALLSGRIAEPGLRLSRWRGGAAAGTCLLAAGAALVVVSPTASAQEQAGLFFAAGGLLLGASLAFFASWLTRDPAPEAGRLTLTRLGMASARRAAGRSLLVAGLMACATFVIAAAGANRLVAGAQLGKNSGTGGFALLAESALPLYRPIAPGVLGGAAAYSLRLKPGDDASCLNLYQAVKPRILGASDEFIERGGFLFSATEARTEDEIANPWRLLRKPPAGGAVPAIGDYNSIVWLLHSGLGKELTIDGTRFRIVGLLRGSVFQSELLIGERDFERLYPSEAGWRFFAIDAAPEKAQALAASLESALEDFGFDATSAAERLNALMAVENTYLQTFQSLGGLGLLLGTLGLALALARNLVERRGEFALLRAVGYRRSALIWLALSENLLLLLVGLASGAVCALIAVAPALAARAAHPPWLRLIGTLTGVFLFGLGAAALAAAAVLRSPALQALKEE